MRAGDMDRRIDIMVPNTGREPVYGSTAKTPTVYLQCWARAKYMKGEERFAAREIQSEIDAIFQIRYDAGVKPIMHIRYNGADYDILSIQEIGRREGLEIVAKRRGGSGGGT